MYQGEWMHFHGQAVLSITKTRLFKYTENFATKNETFR